ncbi:ABC transporter ATP-binding protein [Flavisolibacter tropicus]|uniref:ABC transporter ATP-binding protein n=1 Tax=Flavisolibacter tropicus TaxID=1492898 RepID=UPI000830DC5A|nr:ATP-binding cassette domain-containing protein [Flavisolibacter tropicus]
MSIRTSIKVENISKSFFINNKEVYALKDISFEVAAGEAFGIVGRNGAGKSTLLKILSGIIKPTNGVIRYNGRISSILDLGWSFHPQLSGWENMMLTAQLFGIAAAEVKKKAEEIMEFSELDAETLSRPVYTYSNGMYLRLAFSTVITWPGDILIFDEVLTVGDAMFVIKSAEKLKSLKERGHSIILVSHEMNQINNYCDRVMFIDKGQSIYTGRSDLALNEYQEYFNPYRDMVPDYVPNGCTLLKVNIEVNKTKMNSGEIVAADKDIKIILHLALDHTKSRKDFGLIMNDCQGVQLFGDETLDWPVTALGGNCTIEWMIPANLLNTGLFKVYLFWFEDRKLVGNTSVINFSVASDRPERAASQVKQPFYLKGALRPYNSKPFETTLQPLRVSTN